MKSIIIIPARYGSSRFPGKPLAMLGGEPLIVRVARRVAGAADAVAVATDDERIAEVCRQAGITSVMTRSDHPSGTDRIREAYEKLSSELGEYDVVVNVQGDEPFIDLCQISALIGFFGDSGVDIATMCHHFPQDGDVEDLENPNLVKLVRDSNREALYFSRSVIPYLRGVDRKDWPSRHDFLTHIGVYAYRPSALRRITEMLPGELEKAESLEQLRWLQAGMRIMVGDSSGRNIGIDTPEDLERAERQLASEK